MIVESVPRVWREKKYKYRLIGSRCKSCGSTFFPPKAACKKCGSRDLEEIELPKRGKIITYTVVRSPPRGFEYLVPYVIAIVELEDGTRVLTQITDVNPEEVKTGMQVEAVFRKLKEQSRSGIIEYGIKFRPIR
ncbi:MAG: transcriptional regulator [Thermoprotei archaeon]|nr:MAG: transcriptional regulator [Thermoprotei archaeon]